MAFVRVPELTSSLRLALEKKASRKLHVLSRLKFSVKISDAEDNT